MMNLWFWVAILFVGHLALYYYLGTENWVLTATLATAVWAGVLMLIRLMYRRRREEEI